MWWLAIAVLGGPGWFQSLLGCSRPSSIATLSAHIKAFQAFFYVIYLLTIYIYIYVYICINEHLYIFSECILRTVISYEPNNAFSGLKSLRESARERGIEMDSGENDVLYNDIQIMRIYIFICIHLYTIYIYMHMYM